MIPTVNNGVFVECIYANKKIVENTTISLNAADAFMIQCKAHGVGPRSAADNNRIPGFMVIKTLCPSSITVRLAGSGMTPLLSINNGLLVYDTMNGNTIGHDHVIARSQIAVYEQSMVSSGYIIMYIPSLTPNDAATYYFCFMDGVYYTNASDTSSLICSYAITLKVNTKTNSAISSKKLTNKINQVLLITYLLCFIF